MAADPHGTAAGIDPQAAVGFGRGAQAYERGRPEYPVQAIRWLSQQLGLEPGRTALDVGAGTGKLTRALAPTGARIIAVEPVAEMRAVLEQLLPGAAALAGTAERLPVADASADAVVAGQAFHWFDGSRALREFHRVLRAGGRLGLIWNRRDRGQPLHREINRIIEPYRRGAPSHHTDRWRAVFEGSALFSLHDEARIPSEQELEAEQFVDRVMSISFVSCLEGKERQGVLERLRALAAQEREPLRHLTEIFVYTRLD